MKEVENDLWEDVISVFCKQGISLPNMEVENTLLAMENPLARDQSDLPLSLGGRVLELYGVTGGFTLMAVNSCRAKRFLPDGCL